MMSSVSLSDVNGDGLIDVFIACSLSASPGPCGIAFNTGVKNTVNFI